MKFRKRIPINQKVDLDSALVKIGKINGVTNAKIEENFLIVDSNVKILEKDIMDILFSKDDSKTEEFYFDNIDCPNCANKVEVALNKSPLIVEATVVFLSNKIIIKHREDNIYDEVVSVVKTIEKDTNIYANKDEMNKKVSLVDLVNKTEHHVHEHEHTCDCNHEHCHEHNCDSHHNHHHEDCKCCHTHDPSRPCESKKNNKENTRDFVKKLMFILGSSMFGVATIILIIGNKEIMGIFRLEPLLKGYAYLIPLFTTYIISYILLSYDLIYKSVYGLLHKDYFNESLLMVIASLGAIVLSFIGDIELFEACAVVLLYKIGESLQNKATEKSKNAIKGLVDIEIDNITLKDGGIKKIDEVKIGEIIVVKVGEKIPLDGNVYFGSSTLDMKVLTGESEPVYVNVGDEVLSGSLNLTNVIEIKVAKENSESTVSKVKRIIEEANSKKSKSEEFITKFARIYTPIILIIALIALIVQLLLKVQIQEALNNVFAILVISCPCSLVISIPLGYFAAIGCASKNGILVKGGNYLESLTNVEKIIFDKTGTITKGEFEIVEIVPNKITKEELLKVAAMVESYSNHPIATSIKKAYHFNFNLENAIIEEIAGNGLKMEMDNQVYLVGNDRLMIQNGIQYILNDSIGSIIYVSKDREFLGSIVLRDQIKPDSKRVISKLKEKGISSLILTGDKKKFGEFVGKEVGIDEVYSELLPQDKYQVVDELIKGKKKNIVYIGDGINDTPSLRRADVGIALGGIGSDLAKETADVVIMNDDIYKIIDVINISKYTKKIIVQNVVFILLTKLLAMAISMSGLLSSYAMLLAIFADVGVCLLCILNSLRILTFKTKK